MRKVLILGATSMIAQHCCRLWAAQGDALYLVGRNQERLESIAADARVRGANSVHTACIDLNLVDQHESLLKDANTYLGGIDVVLIAHGTLPKQRRCEESVDLTLQQIHTNALSTVSLLTLFANLLEARRAGTLAVITSVAGDRGRASNYVYGSAKALVNSFLSGLRQRLHQANVVVLTIKPGFVDTPMTAEFKKGPLWAQPDEVARRIILAIERGELEIYVPWFWRYIMAVIKGIPLRLFRALKL